MWQLFWLLDQLIFRFIHKDWHFEALDSFMVFLTSSGLGHVQLLIFVLSYWCLPKQHVKLTTIISFGAFAGLLRLPLMLWIHRERPSNFSYSIPLEKVFGASSFPSGHATTSFAIAFSTWTLTHKTQNAWVGYVMILWSLGVGYSRCYVGVHYPSDIVGSALLALICNKIWTIFLTKKRWLLYKEHCHE